MATTGIPAIKQQHELLKADILRFLSRLFDYPSQERVAEVRHLINALCEQENLPEPWKDSLKSIRETLEHLQTQDLQDLYSSLFIQGKIPLCETAAHPEYDAYSRLAVIYQAFGLKPQPGEAPDHITRELEFLSFLCVKRVLAPSARKRALTEEYYQRFVQDHIHEFLIKLAARLAQEGDRARLYLDGVHLAMQVLEDVLPQKA